MVEKVFADMLDLSLSSPFEISVVSLGGLSTQWQRPFRINQRATLDRQLEDLAKQVSDRFFDNPYFESLTKITEKAKRAAIPYLSEQLGNDNWNLRWQAARVLGALGSNAKDSVPVLRAMTEDSNSFVRYAAGEALERIGHEDG